LPYLHLYLWFSCLNNPISDIFQLHLETFNILDNTPYSRSNRNNNLNKLYHFREFYFLSKFKKKFISWMWKSREPRIKEQFHYKYLEEIIKINENNPDFDLNEFIENWK